tara:strand:+ start:160 stop:495 length:336 start_codon:yes stop_codon:yes gene_type:complete
MKTIKTILIAGALGEFNEISGLNTDTKRGTILLKNVVFKPQLELWAGYGTPLDKKGTVLIEEKDESGLSIMTWKLLNAYATQFSTNTPINGSGPSFKSIELSYEDISKEVS